MSDRVMQSCGGTKRKKGSKPFVLCNCNCDSLDAASWPDFTFIHIDNKMLLALKAFLYNCNGDTFDAASQVDH